MKFLKIIGIIFLVLILLIVGVLGYLGFVPGVSTLFGSDKPRDLGVKHTAQDFQKAQEKLQQTSVPPSADPFAQFKTAPGKPIDVVLTQEEYSAHVEKAHPVSDLQVKLDGSSFQISGRIDKSRIPQFVRTWGVSSMSDKEIIDTFNAYVPVDPIFYISGTGDVKDNKLTINLTSAEFGRLPVPPEQAKEIVKLYTETLLQQIPGISVETSTVENGQLHFKGSMVSELPEY